jgi:hypothetical protein
VSFQVQDKSADTRQKSHGWPLFLLLDISLREVIGSSQRNVWEEGKEMLCRLSFSCGPYSKIISKEVD